MKVLVNDTQMEAVSVRYKPDSNGEPWTEYLLDDGTVIRFRSVLVSIMRVTDHWAATGEPLYHWHSQTSTIVIAPDHLRQDAQESLKVAKVQ